LRFKFVSVHEGILAMRVLITDDSATIRMILKGLLKQLQITDIKEASDGHTALELLDQEKFDLLLLDIHMPVVDGLKCLEQLKLREATAALPVIMISSDTTPSQIAAAEKLGAHAYIKKPFRIEGLRDAIAAVSPALNPTPPASGKL
jgi:two-component system chemotaxis response regulator CheY